MFSGGMCKAWRICFDTMSNSLAAHHICLQHFNCAMFNILNPTEGISEASLGGRPTHSKTSLFLILEFIKNITSCSFDIEYNIIFANLSQLESLARILL